ncbi:MAG: DDE-type integrase/transposase/recombinase, partial [Acidimicrobiia bacterium]
MTAGLRLGLGRRVNHKRVERLMRLHHIVGLHRPRRKRGCTRRDPNASPATDLVNRVFSVSGPDRLWCGDITEHPTLEGKVYLCAVLDAWSRRVVGWSIADHLRAELVVDALDMATWRRRPATQTIMHTDHGTQGGIRWWSQHLDAEVLWDVNEARAATSDPCDAREDLVAGSAFD